MPGEHYATGFWQFAAWQAVSRVAAPDAPPYANMDLMIETLNGMIEE